MAKKKVVEDKPIVSLMAPASGDSGEVKAVSPVQVLDKYEQIISKDGHTYYVIGELPNGLRISMRMYKEASAPGNTAISLRLRVGDHLTLKAGTQEYPTFPALDKYWTGQSSVTAGHRSIMGTMFLPVAAWNKQDVVGYSEGSGYPEAFITRTMSLFEDSTCITPKHCSQLFAALIFRALQDVYPPIDAKGKTFFSLGMGGKVMLIENGVYVNQEPTTATVTIKPYAAPHPKDAKKALPASKAA